MIPSTLLADFPVARRHIYLYPSFFSLFFFLLGKLTGCQKLLLQGGDITTQNFSRCGLAVEGNCRTPKPNTQPYAHTQQLRWPLCLFVGFILYFSTCWLCLQPWPWPWPWLVSPLRPYPTGCQRTYEHNRICICLSTLTCLRLPALRACFV